MANHKVEMITQIGSKLGGTWAAADSTIPINVKGETKQVDVKELAEETMGMVTDPFRLSLARK
jgi:hypothetical protein